MKTPKLILSKGMSLLEITLVLGLTLALITALLFGIAAFQEGADRAKCIMNLCNMQKAMRSFMNLYEFRPGANVAENPPAGIANNITENVIGTGKFIDKPLRCPSLNGGVQSAVYTITSESIFPAVGEMWAECPTKKDIHVPKSKDNM